MLCFQLTPQPQNGGTAHQFADVGGRARGVPSAPWQAPKGHGAGAAGEGLCGGGWPSGDPHGLQPQEEGLLLGGGAGEVG